MVMELEFKFERVGRRHNVPPVRYIMLDGETPDELAEFVHKWARQYLGSREFDVAVEFDCHDGGEGTVSIGWGRMGTGVVREILLDPETDWEE